MMAVLAALGALIGFVVSWLFRNRRRGEVFTLVFVLALSFLAFIPATILEDLDAPQAHAARGERGGLQGREIRRVAAALEQARAVGDLRPRDSGERGSPDEHGLAARARDSVSRRA